ncbi:GTP cyclohydrolase 1 type 2 homolog [Serratia symbiotica]|nr:GTP cyclohydrolase 1 type 2 homolog [Serratia symbiotica]
MRNLDLEILINRELNTAAFQDYAPNGLQVEGRPNIQRIVTGVTACQALLDAAVKEQADAIIVHHGYFWKNEAAVICGMKRNRIKTLLSNDINLYGYHLPLDSHPIMGNNAQLAQALGIRMIGKVQPLVPHGEFEQPLTGDALQQHIAQCLSRNVLYFGDNAPAYIRRVAWSTGGGQHFIESAARFGVDAFISGEVSEQTIHIAQEMGINFFAAGHHATERGGVKTLGEWLAQYHGFRVTFIDIPNPA